MINVLIVDDEPIYRLALREMIDWEALGCRIAAEASNGADALRLLSRETIDLVLVDIQMPIMTGLEFIERVRGAESLRHTGIVVLSAYSQYEYVRRAFVLGVYDYIVKEDFSTERTDAVIARAVDRLREEMDLQARQELESTARLEKIKEEALALLLRAGQGDGGERLEALPEEAQQWLAAATGKRHVLGCLLPDRPDLPMPDTQLPPAPWSPDGRQLRFLRHAIRQAADRQRLEAVTCALSEVEHAVLLLLPDEPSQMQAHATSAEAFRQIVHQAGAHLNLSVTAGISRPCDDSAVWPARYATARRCAEQRFYVGGGRTFFEAETSPLVAGLTGPVWPIAAMLQDMEQGQADWKAKLEAGYRTLEKARPLPAERATRHYKAFCWELESLLLAKGIGWEQLLGDTAKPSELIERFDRQQRLNDWFMALLSAAAELIHPKRMLYEQAPPLINRIKGWIDRHCHEPISLAAVSEAAGISESYLSKVFAKESGETFVEYLTRRRIDKAIEMLGTGMKIYEIGEKVGYPNQGHFSKTFKKITGRSPQEYRDELQRHS